MPGPLLKSSIVSLLLATAWAKTSPPNVIFVLTDDLGWNFPGYHNSAVKTPTIDHLATKEGVRLEQSYMYKYCSPSRGSLMTGRYPWHLPSVRCNFIPSSIPEGVDLDYVMLPKHLAKAGYISTHIGKWHLGFHKASYTPVARGFNYSFGFLEGGEDHWTHKCGAGALKCKVPGDSPKNFNYRDLWSQSHTDFPGGPVRAFTNATVGDESSYSGYIFTEKAVKSIEEHNSSHPMFMYLALHNTHSPVEAPQRFIDMYDSDDSRKNTFMGMVSVVDETMQNITAALKARGMWENTLLIWSTDNGSPIHVAGSNHPLRGGKGSNWEGGVRVPTFVSGGALPASMKGKELDGLVHVSDWFSTISAMAGLGELAPAAGPAPASSHNLWPYISGAVKDSPRNELVHDHHMFTNASAVIPGSSTRCGGQNPFQLPGYSSLGAIRVGKYKLIVGTEFQASWYGQFAPNTTVPKPDVGVSACTQHPCLFDIAKDPAEHVDISREFPQITQQLWARFNRSNAEPHPRVISPAQDAVGFCGAVKKTGGWVAPWM